MTSDRKLEYSLLRLVAMTMIIFCHIFEQIGIAESNFVIEHFGNFLAAGVQIFLILSGMLYGLKENLFENESRVSFIFRNFKKILLPYYVYVLLVVIPLYFFTGKLQRDSIHKVATLFRLLTCSGTIDGVHHFWFIPYILFCYLITPLLYDIRKHCASSKERYITAIVSLVLVEVLFFAYKSYFIAAWINCYILAFLTAPLIIIPSSQKKKTLKMVLCGAVFPVSVFMWHKARFELLPLYNNMGGV